jgi:hypothetical protein
LCSNSAGENPDNFYNICTDSQYGFKEHHATTMDNPVLPKPLTGEARGAWLERRERALADLITEDDPLVYAQEYLAHFVDWAGVAFFSPDKLDVGRSARRRASALRRSIRGHGYRHQDRIRTRRHRGGIFCGRQNQPSWKLTILDWDIQKIEGALLKSGCRRYTRSWKASRNNVARFGRMGAFIEDKGSGTVLLQQARRRGWTAHPIEISLTAMGKDERALSVSGYHYRGLCKITDAAASKRKDDLTDAYTYGLSIALGNQEGW